MGGRAAAEGPTGLAHTLLSGSCRGPASAQCNQEPRTWPLDSQLPAGPMTCCVTLGKCVSLSGPQAPPETDQGSGYPSWTTSPDTHCLAAQSFGLFLL